MEVAAVKKREVKRGLAQSPSTVQSSEASANDDNFVRTAFYSSHPFKITELNNNRVPKCTKVKPLQLSSKEP
jgi:hypothetical protein